MRVRGYKFEAICDPGQVRQDEGHLFDKKADCLFLTDFEKRTRSKKPIQKVSFFRFVQTGEKCKLEPQAEELDGLA